MSPIMRVVLNVESHGFNAIHELMASHDGDAHDLVAEGKLIHLGADTVIELGGLEDGMTGGKPSVAICFPLPDGRVVLAETSLALLKTSVLGLATKLEGT